MKKLFLFIVSIFLLLSQLTFAFAAEKGIEINFFYSNTCPHCKNEKEFLEKELAQKYPDIKINQYEVISSLENQNLLRSFYEKYDVPESQWGLVPVTFTPDKYFIGFNDETAKELEACLQNCIGGGNGGTLQKKVKIPFFGEVDISTLSLPVLTIVFGALDGFNPCAMWVLIFLIILLLNTKSRKRMWLIGGSFLLVSGLVYFLILSAWLNLFFAISFVNTVRILIGLFAVSIGAWQIINFLKFQPGVCKIFEKKQSGFLENLKSKLKLQAEKIASAPFGLPVFLGVAFLAVGINLVEFFCSAGLPAIYTQILSLQKLSSASYYFYLLVYTLIFMLDDAIVLTVAIITLSKIKTAEKYNYWITLFGGMLMLALGLLLIFRPELLMFA